MGHMVPSGPGSLMSMVLSGSTGYGTRAPFWAWLLCEYGTQREHRLWDTCSLLGLAPSVSEVRKCEKGAFYKILQNIQTEVSCYINNHKRQKI